MIVHRRPCLPLSVFDSDVDVDDVADPRQRHEHKLLMNTSLQRFDPGRNCRWIRVGGHSLNKLQCRETRNAS